MIRASYDLGSYLMKIIASKEQLRFSMLIGTRREKFLVVNESTQIEQRR